MLVCLTEARVHFQHTAELLNRLVKVDANYSLQLYPDEGHTLRDPRSIQHFKRTVVTYFQNCLKHSIFQDPIEDDDEEDDDWAQCSLPTSWMTLPGLYAILCITLGWSTRAQEQGPSTSDPLMQPPENLVYDWKLLHTIIFHCIFKSLSVYKILSRQSGLEDSWIC